MNSLLTGFLLIFFAAVCGGAFAVPIKLRRRFELENLYVIAGAVTMILLPLVVGSLFLPSWNEAMMRTPPKVLWVGLGFGFAWGIGAVTFGYGVNLAGLSLGYAVIMGINTAVGSMLPILVRSPWELHTAGGLVIVGGIAACIVGVAICGRAGFLREHGESRSNGARRQPDRNDASIRPDSLPAAALGETGPPASSKNFRLGLTLCVISGVLSACANLGFTFTSQIAAAAQKLGGQPIISSLGSWFPVYWGGFAATLLWFGGLQVNRKSWRKNVGPGAWHDWGLALVMGVLWFLAMIPYGMGAYCLGQLGTSVGWAVDIASSLIVANVLGFLTGEWKAAPPGARRALFTGLGVLVLAMAILGKGNAMFTH